jgi:hypothetical protein
VYVEKEGQGPGFKGAANIIDNDSGASEWGDAKHAPPWSVCPCILSRMQPLRGTPLTRAPELP